MNTNDPIYEAIRDLQLENNSLRSRLTHLEKLFDEHWHPVNHHATIALPVEKKVDMR